MVLTDTHTHLYAEEFNVDREKLIQHALQMGISRFFLPNIDVSSLTVLRQLTEAYPHNCFPMMGLHPCSIKEDFERQLSEIEKELFSGKYFAVGEIGIDLYWDKTFVKEQETAFIRQTEWAHKTGLPIVIHSRNSTDEIIQVLKNNWQLNARGIFHCFSGNITQAQEIIELGFYLGIGGVVTFKNSGLDKVVEQIDLKHLVLETDAPYLAPAPHRGKRNIPEFLYLVAEKIAGLKKISIEEVAEVTTANSKIIFGI